MTERPRFWDRWAELAQVAAFLHAGAAKRYPQLVAAGKVSQAEADAAIRAIAAVDADWQRTQTFAPASPETATRLEKIAVLETAAASYARRATVDPGNEELADLAACVAALHWWACRIADIATMVDFNIEARRLYARPPLEQAA